MIAQRFALIVLALVGATGILAITGIVERSDMAGDGFLWIILGCLTFSTLVLSSLILRGPTWRRLLFMLLNTVLAVALSGLIVGFGSVQMFGFASVAFRAFGAVMIATPLNIPIWIACGAAAFWLGERPRSEPLL